MMKNLNQRFKLVVGVFLFLLLMLPVTDVKAESKQWNDYEYHYAETKSGARCVQLDKYNGKDVRVDIPKEIDGYKVMTTPKEYAHPEEIKSIGIPQYVRYIDLGIFKIDPDTQLNRSALVNLEEITVDPKNKYFKSIDGVLFDTYGRSIGSLLYYPDQKRDKTYRVPTIAPKSGTPKSIHYIYNKHLEHLIFGKDYWSMNIPLLNVKTLTADGTIRLCGPIYAPNLKTVIAKEGLKRIAGFDGMKNLETVILPDSLEYIALDTFRGCSSLKNIKLPSSLKEIRGFAFTGCSSLKEIRIPDSVVCLDADAFYQCPAKVQKASYLKKNKKGASYYYAMAPVKNKGKIEEYRASNITKIQPEDKTVTLYRKHNKKLKTVVSVKHNRKGILDPSLLTYRSNKNNVVRVTKKGTLKPVKKGKAIITVSLRTGGLSYKVKVRVK